MALRARPRRGRRGHKRPGRGASWRPGRGRAPGREGRPAWLRALGKRIAPAPKVAGGCAGCDGCDDGKP
ncbi:DUF6587 family protein [Accumulibacter sp.]|uniref:DUF6587 family protein n=1 Tax=Accumulibacter sp. TaxID=2053492 RepID=UPI00344F7796